MKMTNEKRQALIADCKASIERIEKSIPHWVNSTYTRPYLESELARQKIALAALTAEPVKVPDEPNGSDAPSHLDEYEATCWVAGACWMRAEALRLNGILIHEGAIDNTAQQYEALAGWKMVPVEPSKEMRSQIHPIADGNCSHCGNRTTLDCEENMLLSWRDMLEAAPKPEGKDG